MKNTLPLSSFPLHGLLTIESYYIPFVSVVMFFLLLYKTYNLPYTSGMSAQEGILLTLFVIVMLSRNSQGIAANKVIFYCNWSDVRLDKNGGIYFHDSGRHILLYLLHVHSVLCHADWDDFLHRSYHFQWTGIVIRVLFVLAVPKLLKTAMSSNIVSK